ncbi:MAG: asparagine synthase (glutamine-hydrolyzing) [bacterium]
MCGITGTLNLKTGTPPSEAMLRQMLAMIRHRGPDEFGIYLDDHIGLGSARLSIVDLSGGQQPITNEDHTLWIVFNGEIFNHIELRPELEAQGHRFTTHADTEILIHLYEEYGPACLSRLNGQFALAIWDARHQTLFLARDRLGVRPLFYTVINGSLVFGSEIKAILTVPEVKAELDPITLDQIFTFWSPLSPRSIFKGIVELPPGHYLLAHAGKTSLTQYWKSEFPSEESALESFSGRRHPDSYLDELESLLLDAVKLRLRADVPVGAYLSGGLDSSLITALIRRCATTRLDTFSISFNDVAFDESPFQRQMAAFLNTDHQVVQASYADIGRVFPDVIWHTEIPIMRTSPAPMFLLSQRVRECGYKVVLTGEGADEFLAGYDIFKEAKVRRFSARQPQSTWRSLLFKRLYPDLTGLAKTSPAFLSAFFQSAETGLDDPFFSHAIRWKNNRHTCRFFSKDLIAHLAGQPCKGADQVAIPPEFKSWDSLAQAQFLESSIFMSQYLLSSQGDRMGMAHSIEGRFPFLDYRVVEFCNRLPSSLKLRGLTEKFLLKKLGRKWLPSEIWQRPKRPYRAPIHRSFFSGSAAYVRDLLSPGMITKTGLFNADAVTQLVNKTEKSEWISETADMTLAGIISTQLLHSLFIDRFTIPPPISHDEPVNVHRNGTGAG